MSDSGSSSGKKKPVQRVNRRRPSGSTSSSGRERAQAPRRQGRSDQAGRASTPTERGQSEQRQTRPPIQPPPQSFRPRVVRPSGGGRAIRLSPRLMMLLLALAALFLCVVFAVPLLFGDGGGDLGGAPLDQGGQVFATPVPSTPVPAATNKPFVPPVASASGDTWLVMLYQDADDKVLEKDIYVDLNEAERIGSTNHVQIVSQLDRYAGGYSDDGNWTTTKRFYVTQDNDLTRVGSQLVADLGEQNMADGDTLVDFCTWAIETFPADKLVLIMSDHGMGWPGGWSDPAPATRADNSTPLSAAAGNQMYLNEMDAALQTIRDQTGIDKFELVGLDACLMGQIEVFSMLAPHALYAVASEETEPALGWAYAGFLGELATNPSMTGAELGALIVNSYIDDDQRIVDDAARADLLSRGSPMGGLFGAQAPTSAQVASQMGRDVTLSAVDLAQVPALVDSLNALCLALQGADQRPVAQARSYAQSYTNIFGRQVPPAYLDLGHFCQLLQQNNPGAQVSAAAGRVLAATQSAVIAEKHGREKPGSTGIAIYFPNSQLFRTPATGPASYTAIAGQFARASLWDDYMAFHYTGRRFEASAQQAVVPQSGAAVTAPGQGVISMSPVQTSSDVAAPGAPILLSTEISGDNLGYVLLFAGYFDRDANSLNVSDMDYLESEDTRQVQGVYYPVWPEEAFTLAFEWEPIVFYISDGVDSVPALLTPQTYGASGEKAVYTVDGIYTFESGESRQARLYFQDGQLRQVFGFTGDGSAGAPREIYPQTGDRFTVADRWLDLDAQGRIVASAVEQGGTLTFGTTMFTWEELDAAAGDYVVGFVTVDLDGDRQQAFTQVVVQ